MTFLCKKKQNKRNKTQIHFLWSAVINTLEMFVKNPCENRSTAMSSCHLLVPPLFSAALLSSAKRTMLF